MYQNKRNKKRSQLPSLKPGDIVEYRGGTVAYYYPWIKENRLYLREKYFNDKIKGTVLKARSESGPMYRVIEINGEQFEILLAQLSKLN